MTRIRPLFSVSPRQLGRLKAEGERRLGRRVKDLTLWFEFRLRPGVDGAAFLAGLRQVQGIEHAEPAPLPAPSPAVTPSFVDDQGYLDPATDGIDAEFSWTIAGGSGAGVAIYDVEYSWNQGHEDLTKAASVSLLLDGGDSAVDPFADNNHGTAVLGELIADNDDKGVTGISWGASIGLAPANTNDLGYNPANAIALAAADGTAGDVILIEQQTTVCGLPSGSYGPAEWTQSVFDAIEAATAAGLIVVEAAGNGGVDLDQASCDGRFDRNVRDSGAIIVGAGASPGSSDRQRLGFSSYGSRVDLQGWGQNVMTTGYGTGYVNPDDPSNPDVWYTSSFSGTSSASPIVTGAVANLQGIAMASGLPLFTAADVRQLLIDTGSPQQGNTAEHIGPRPNLAAAIAQILNLPPVADAGEDQTLECASPSGNNVTLDASGSSDPNPGDVLTYTWRENGEIIAGPTADATVQVTLALGEHTIELTVDDGELTDTDEVVITVEDTTPPEIVVADEPMTLWPPNHMYSTLSLSDLSITVTDVCDATLTSDDVVITSVWSDEPDDAKGGGDGFTTGDIVISSDGPDPCRSVELMVERQGGANGRVYTLELSVADASGNINSTEYQVHIPQDINISPLGVDDGQVNVVNPAACAIPTSASMAAKAAREAEENAGEVLSERAAAQETPEDYVLDQNHPNPFNPTTVISFALPEASEVRLTIYDVTGREVARLVNGTLSAGQHEVQWNAATLPSGMYLYQIAAGRFVETRRMVLLK